MKHAIELAGEQRTRLLVFSSCALNSNSSTGAVRSEILFSFVDQLKPYLDHFQVCIAFGAVGMGDQYHWRNHSDALRYWSFYIPPSKEGRMTSESCPAVCIPNCTRKMHRYRIEIDGYYFELFSYFQPCLKEFNIVQNTNSDCSLFLIQETPEFCRCKNAYQVVDRLQQYACSYHISVLCANHSFPEQIIPSFAVRENGVLEKRITSGTEGLIVFELGPRKQHLKWRIRQEYMLRKEK